jgi:hypothetical protein
MHPFRGSLSLPQHTRPMSPEQGSSCSLVKLAPERTLLGESSRRRSSFRGTVHWHNRHSGRLEGHAGYLLRAHAPPAMRAKVRKVVYHTSQVLQRRLAPENRPRRPGIGVGTPSMSNPGPHRNPRRGMNLADQFQLLRVETIHVNTPLTTSTAHPRPHPPRPAPRRGCRGRVCLGRRGRRGSGRRGVLAVTSLRQQAQQDGRCSRSSRSLWRPAACFILRSQRRDTNRRLSSSTLSAKTSATGTSGKPGM